MDKLKPALQSQYAALLVDMVCENSSQRLNLLSKAEIRPALLSSQDALLNQEQLSRLIHYAVEQSNDPALGIRFGERLNLMTHGALGQAIMSCNNLEQALDLLLKYYRTRMLSVDINIQHQQDMMVLSLSSELDDPLTYRFMIETIFVCVVRINMFFFGMKLMINGKVEVTYPKPDHIDAYLHTFFDGIRFDQPRNALLFESHLLSLPMAMPNPSALKQAEQACNQILARLPQKQSIKEQVRLLIYDEQRGFATLDEVATMLHMTGRTLRRRLTEAQTSYRQLTDHIKLEQAKARLSAGNTVEAVAEKLGYSDPSNFSRAFRKQAGIPPSEYQNTLSKNQ